MKIIVCQVTLDGNTDSDRLEEALCDALGSTDAWNELDKIGVQFCDITIDPEVQKIDEKLRELSLRARNGDNEAALELLRQLAKN